MSDFNSTPKPGNRLRHGHCPKLGRPTKIWKCWASMLERCKNPNAASYKRYGGRGITVCKRWRVFENFLADMGDLPFTGATIDRIKNSGNYKPSNCRWATKSEQAHNRRSTRWITYNGETKSATQWSEITGIGYGSILRRLKTGWPVDKALTVPSGLYRAKGRIRPLSWVR